MAKLTRRAFFAKTAEAGATVALGAALIPDVNLLPRDVNLLPPDASGVQIKALVKRPHMSIGGASIFNRQEVADFEDMLKSFDPNNS